ncbi:MAG: DnaB-like helicase C-terminal domain-containing protein, partial [Rikenellaceae bacterium]|nr:DnaB-like helicase C-terminal domain-containing protein [Rikenellaceae bacterium]
YGLTEDEQGMPTAGVAELIVAKHRNGAVDTVKLRFRKEQAKFMDLDEAELDRDGMDPLGDGGFGAGANSAGYSSAGGFGGTTEIDSGAWDLPATPAEYGGTFDKNGEDSPF